MYAPSEARVEPAADEMDLGATGAASPERAERATGSAENDVERDGRLSFLDALLHAFSLPHT